MPSVSFGLPYNCCAGSGWAAKLLDRSGSAAEEGLKGGRCHPSVSDYHITAVLGLAGSGWAAKLLDRSGSAAEEGLKGGRCHPSVSDYHITAVLGLAGPLSCLTDRALVLRSGSLEGCHPSVSDYHITAVLGLAGPLSCLTDRALLLRGFEGGKVPSVSFGLPYNCCAGSGWAAKLLDRLGSLSC